MVYQECGQQSTTINSHRLSLPRSTCTTATRRFGQSETRIRAQCYLVIRRKMGSAVGSIANVSLRYLEQLEYLRHNSLA